MPYDLSTKRNLFETMFAETYGGTVSQRQTTSVSEYPWHSRFEQEINRQSSGEEDATQRAEENANDKRKLWRPY